MLLSQVYILSLAMQKRTKLEMSPHFYQSWRPRIQPKNCSKAFYGGKYTGRVDSVSWMIGTLLQKIFGQPKQGNVAEIGQWSH